MSEDKSVGGKVDSLIDKVKGLDFKSALKKSVTVPVKVLAICVIAVVVLAFALSLSRRVEPRVASLVGDMTAQPLDVVTAAVGIESLKAHITATCKPSGASAKTDAKKVK